MQALRLPPLLPAQHRRADHTVGTGGAIDIDNDIVIDIVLAIDKDTDSGHLTRGFHLRDAPDGRAC